MTVTYLSVKGKTRFLGECEKPRRYNFIKTQILHDRSEKVSAFQYRQVGNFNKFTI